MVKTWVKKNGTCDDDKGTVVFRLLRIFFLTFLRTTPEHKMADISFKILGKIPFNVYVKLGPFGT